MRPLTLRARALAGAILASLITTASAAEPIRLGMIEGMSGAFANTGDAVARNLNFAVERINGRGGVKIGGIARPLQLSIFDSKGQVEEALIMLNRAGDEKVDFVLQGNSSSVAAALIDAITKRNERRPERMLFLNYSAVDPILTNERCSPWHFRFDAHADMRLAALVDVIATKRDVHRVYLLNQDYSFGRQFAKSARAMLLAVRPDIEIVGDELHPIGRVRDFAPYAAKMKASGADTVLTGNWGNDLTLLVRAAREADFDARFFTFYGNGLGAPAAIGDAGIEHVWSVAEWQNNAGPESMQRLYEAFRKRYPDPRDDYFQPRVIVMIDMLARAIEAAGTTAAPAVARALAGMRYTVADGNPLGDVVMRTEDHQLIGPLVVSVMARAGSPGVVRDLEGSGYGFRTERSLTASQTSQPSACRMADLP